MKKHLSIILFFLVGSLQATNENLAFNSSENLGGEIIACNSITLNSGFSFEAKPTESLVFKLNPALCALGGIDNPIEIGEFEKGFSFTHTIDTQNLSDNFQGSYGDPTNEVFYKLRLRRSMRVIISTKDSPIEDIASVAILNYKKEVLHDNYERDPHNFYGYLDVELEAGEYYIVSEGVFIDGIIKTSIEATVFVKDLADLGSFSSDFKQIKSVDTRSNCIDGYFTGNNWGEDNFKDQFYQFSLLEPMLIKVYFNDPDLYPPALGLAPDPTYYLINSYGERILVTNNLNLPRGKYTLIVEALWTDGVIITNIEGKKETLNFESRPSKGQNYIKTRTYTEGDNQTGLDVIQYFDGLGRPTQTQQSNVTPQKQSLLSFQEYDVLGRESKTWLPAPVSGVGAYIQNPASIIQSYYNDSAYSRPVYETSPLSRVVEQYQPGKEWYAKEINEGVEKSRSLKINYLTNNETHFCYKYKLSSRDTPGMHGKYANGQLYVTETIDEDGNRSYEFKDKQNRLVLSRQMNGVEPHDTYYIYDDFDNLRYVLPPLAVDALNADELEESEMYDILEKYTYTYKYDKRKRTIAKRLPGCDWIYYVYDDADNLIFSQDGEQRKKSEWSFTIADRQKRVVLTGVCKNNISTQAYTNYLDGQVVVAEKDYSSYSIKGYLITINGQDYHLLSPVVYTANYYDDYDFKQAFGNTVYSKLTYSEKADYGKWHNTTSYSSKGLLTGTYVKTLQFFTEKYSTMYYDDRGRLIQTKSSSLDNSIISHEYIRYDFLGQPTMNLKEQYMLDLPMLSEEYIYNYDHTGRLLDTSHSLNGAPLIRLAQNEYDELGRLKSTKANNSEKLKLTYDYNIHSRLKEISGQLFSQKLFYNTTSGYNSVAKPKGSYSGNISGAMWKSGTDYWIGYNYEYDELSRLEKAGAFYVNRPHPTYGGAYYAQYKYDKHGNMSFINRMEDGDSIDELSVYYNGNQIDYIKEPESEIEARTRYDFKDYSGQEKAKYEYNANGAMIKDPYKGMTVEYNNMGRPDRVIINNPITSGSAHYYYQATGELFAVNYNFVNQLSLNPIENQNASTHNKQTQLYTIYVDNKTYQISNTIDLDMVLFDNGYIKDGKYYFYLRDHLGNNCVVADANGQAVQKTFYYPFGMPMGEFETSGYDMEQDGIQPYKYNGKELEPMHGLNLYDYHARRYDFALGRFTTMDPLAEESYDWSPYTYVEDNPVIYTDPTGMRKGDFDDPYQLDEVIVTPKDGEPPFNEASYLRIEKFFLQSQWSNYIDLSRGASIRLGYYNSYNNYISKNAINNAEYAMARYHLAQSARAKMGPISNAISELQKTKKDQLATARRKTLYYQGSSRSTRGTTNTASKITKYGGRGLIGFSAALSFNNIYSSDNKGRAIASEIGGWAGSGIGSKVGSKIGGVIFAPIPYVGKPVGTIIGAVIGGGAGYHYGYQGGEYVYDNYISKF